MNFNTKIIKLHETSVRHLSRSILSILRNYVCLGSDPNSKKEPHLCRDAMNETFSGSDVERNQDVEDNGRAWGWMTCWKHRISWRICLSNINDISEYLLRLPSFNPSRGISSVSRWKFHFGCIINSLLHMTMQ